jgi:hypothetical protein
VAIGRHFKPGVSPKQYGPHCSPVWPANPIFLLSKIDPTLYIMETTLMLLQTLQYCRMKSKQQRYCWKKVKFQIEFELKFLEAKLLFNLN